MVVMHISKTEALAMINEWIKLTDPQKPTHEYKQLYNYIQMVGWTFGGVWQEKEKRFSWPC